jgi:uncharacterized membrane protein YkvA (DUF1232 family)
VEPRLTILGARFIDGEHDLIADDHVARQRTITNPMTARMTAMDNIASTAARLRSSGWQEQFPRDQAALGLDGAIIDAGRRPALGRCCRSKIRRAQLLARSCPAPQAGHPGAVSRVSGSADAMARQLLAVAVVAYALSPLDLIPDFIPVLGYLDDLIVVPLGITLVLKLIPDEVMKDCRERALAETARPTSRAGAIVVVAIWFVLAVLLALWIVELLKG